MLRGIIWFLANVVRVVLPCKVYGKENITKNNTVFMCNHQSVIDTFILVAHLPLNTYFIAKKEIFKNKLFTWVLTNVRIFPIDREGTDLKAIKFACNLLKDGNNLMIFPQGTRKDSPIINVADMHAGTGLFALKNQSTVIPMHFTHKPAFFKKNTLYIGKPVDLSSFEGRKPNSQVLAEFSEIAANAINGLQGQNK